MVPRYRIGIGEGGSQVFLPDRPRRIHFQLNLEEFTRLGSSASVEITGGPRSVYGRAIVCAAPDLWSRCASA